MSRLPIYHNPQTPAHWRSVLNAIDTNFRLTDADIAALQAEIDAAELEIDALQAIVGSSGTAPGAITTGQALYSSGTGTVALARANALATSRVIGFASQTTGGAGLVTYQSVGIITVPGVAANTRYFLSAVTPGLIVTSPDATAGQFIMPVGFGVTTNRLLFVPLTPILI